MREKYFTYCTGGTIMWPDVVTVRELLEYVGGDFQIILDNCEDARKTCGANSDVMIHIDVIENNAKTSAITIKNWLEEDHWDHILKDKNGNVIAYITDAHGSAGPRSVAVPDQAYIDHPEIYNLFIDFLNKLEELRKKEDMEE